MRRLTIKTVHKLSDTDTVLIHAAFTLLCDFIEKEKPEELTGDDLQQDGAEEQNDNLLRLKCLYYWWKYIRPKQEDNSPIGYSGHGRSYDFDTERLHELVSLRVYMWT